MKKTVIRGVASAATRQAQAAAPVPASPLVALLERFQNLGTFAEQLHGQISATADRLTGEAAPNGGDQKAEPQMGGLIGDLQGAAANLDRVLSGIERHAHRLSNDI